MLLGTIFKEALRFYTSSGNDDIRKVNTLETLTVLLRAVLQKDLAGWELMDVLAGNVGESDQVFGVRLRNLHVSNKTVLTRRLATGGSNRESFGKPRYIRLFGFKSHYMEYEAD